MFLIPELKEKNWNENEQKCLDLKGRNKDLREKDWKEKKLNYEKEPN